jgi:hypothetical protein
MEEMSHMSQSLVSRIICATWDFQGRGGRLTRDFFVYKRTASAWGMILEGHKDNNV